jgi:ABC-type multidrug transport system fused ATPase/permease subunit
MQQGQIIERGKHEQLIANRGVYSELVQLQQMNSVE